MATFNSASAAKAGRAERQRERTAPRAQNFRALIDSPGGAHLLGCHVERRAHGGLRLSERRLCGRDDDLGDARIEHLQPRPSILGPGHERVGRLDATVAHLRRMGAREAFTRLQQQLASPRRLELPLSLEDRLQSLTNQQLHDRYGLPSVSSPTSCTVTTCGLRSRAATLASRRKRAPRRPRAPGRGGTRARPSLPARGGWPPRPSPCLPSRARARPGTSRPGRPRDARRLTEVEDPPLRSPSLARRLPSAIGSQARLAGLPENPW